MKKTWGVALFFIFGVAHAEQKTPSNLAESHAVVVSSVITQQVGNTSGVKLHRNDCKKIVAIAVGDSAVAQMSIGQNTDTKTRTMISSVKCGSVAVLSSGKNATARVSIGEIGK